jgi:hypothetical protein
MSTPEPFAAKAAIAPSVRRFSSSLRLLALPLLFAGSTLTACGSDDSEPEPTNAAGPLYAIMYEVYDDSGSTSYLSLLDSLERDQIDLDAAVEYGRGRAFIQSYGGWLFVGDAETPTVKRYSLDQGGQLLFDGEIGFGHYGLRKGAFDSWNVTFINPHKAYLFDFVEGTTIIWNPTTLQIIGDIPAQEEFHRDGWSLEGTPGIVRDGLLFRTFDWANYDEAAYSTDILLGVYDIATDELVKLERETRCPVPGNLVHQDETGNIYFSNWVWPVAGSIMRGAPDTCVLRINAGETGFDPEWTLNYQDVTDGRHGAMFTYLSNGQALVSAFHAERTSFDQTTDPWTYVGSNNWRIWDVDLENMTGAPVEGLGFHGGAYTPVEFDGRLILMVPGGDEDDYATQLFEIIDGQAVPHIKLPGWSYQFVKLR